MEALEYRIKYRSRKAEYRLYPLGDVHAGVLHCAEDKIKAQVRRIKEDPFALWIGMGDYADCITPSDPRWDVGVIADWVDHDNIAECQRQWIVKLFEPIKDKCVGLLEGNHEDSLRLHYHVDFMKNVTTDLGVPFLGYSCFVVFKFARIKNDTTTIIGHFEHGAGWAQTEGGVVNRLKMGLINNRCDFHLMAHLHRIKHIEPPQLAVTHINGPSNSNLDIVEQKRVAACTGSWLRAYMQGVRASYAEKKGYEPLPIGCPVVIIKPMTRDIGIRT